MKKNIASFIFLVLMATISQGLLASNYRNAATKMTSAGNLSLASFPYLRLQLAKDAVNTDDIMIRFNNAATNGFDLNMDATYFQGNGQVNLSSISSDNVNLAINVLPFPQKSVTIKLKLLVKSDGSYNLNLTQLVNVPPLFDIVLKDNYTMGSLDIRHTNSYRFDVLKSDTNTYGSARFSLIVRQNPALGLQLLNFSATKTDSGAKIAWTTANEQNYTNFTVERSTDDGQHFSVIDTLTSGAIGAYAFLDKNPLTGTDLYRVKLTDIAGAINLSATISIVYGDPNNTALSIYPNPANGTLNLTINPATGGSGLLYKIQIFNTTGDVIKSATTRQKTSQTDVSGLTPGTYIIRVINSKGDRVVGRGTFIKF